MKRPPQTESDALPPGTNGGSVDRRHLALDPGLTPGSATSGLLDLSVSQCEMGL